MLIPPTINLPSLGPNIVHALAVQPMTQPEVQAVADILANIEKDAPAPRLVKLARSGMRSHAARMLKQQDGLCPLCRQPIDLTIKGEGVIDHDHDTGRIRGLLHRSCNAAEGKIANAAARWGAKSSRYSDIIAYLEHLTAYLRQPASNMIYPMHKTVDEKKELVLKRKREQRAAIAVKRKLAQQKRQGTNGA